MHGLEKSIGGGDAAVMGCNARSTMSRLREQKQHTEMRLEKINEAIELFEKNPEIARGLDLLGSI